MNELEEVTDTIDRLEDTLSDKLTAVDRGGNVIGIADVIQDGYKMISGELKRLGNNDAATPLGAIEAHGLAVKEAAHEIASALNEIAEAIRCLQ